MTILKVIFYVLESLVFAVLGATVIMFLFGGSIVNVGQGVIETLSTVINEIKAFHNNHMLASAIISFIVVIPLLIVGFKMLFKERY
ncbi:TPA: hypothetical protein PP025_002744 [Staphylococcus aureus]|nr:hypothetical protein [Staphylococcus aureus]HDJ2457112.1 hypothetical protein [Staphylococcus aureus]HDJ2561323.1 hypothetical protein [Staphylococcus aureus]HDJ2707921.1 hypothetical protein [Staphylococcus aureus]